MKKTQRLLLKLTYWLPRLVVLNGLWLLASLTLVELVAATRAVAQLTLIYRQQGLTTNSVWRDFWQTKKQFQRRYDRLLSVWLWLVGADLLFLYGQPGAVYQIGGSALFIASAAFLLVCTWRVAATPQSSWLFALVQCGRHLVQVSGQILCNLVVFALLATVGQGFALLAGGALLISLNMAIVHACLSKQQAATRTGYESVY